MKKRVLSFAIACLMVVSTFIISRPLVDVHAVEFEEGENQWTLPMDWYRGLEIDEATGWDLVKKGPWKLSFFENPDDPTSINEDVSTINASDAMGKHGWRIGPTPYIESGNNRVWTVSGASGWTTWYVNPDGRWKGGSVFYCGDNATYMGISPMNGTVPGETTAYTNNNATVVFTVPEGKDGIYSYSEMVTAVKFADANGVEISVTATVRKNGSVINSFTPTSENPSKNIMGKVVLQAGDILMFTFTLNTLDATVEKASDPVIKLGKTVVRRVSDEVKIYDLPTDFCSSTTNGAWTIGGMDMRNETVYGLAATTDAHTADAWTRNIVAANGTTVLGSYGAWIYNSQKGVFGFNPGSQTSDSNTGNQRSWLAATATFTAPEDGIYSYSEIAYCHGTGAAGLRAASYFVMKDGAILDIVIPSLTEPTTAHLDGTVPLKAGEKLVFGSMRYVPYTANDSDWIPGVTPGAWFGSMLYKLSTSKIGELTDQSYNKYSFTPDFTSLTDGQFTMGALDMATGKLLPVSINSSDGKVYADAYTTPLFWANTSGYAYNWGPAGGNAPKGALGAAVIFTAPKSGTYALGSVFTKQYCRDSATVAYPCDYKIIRPDGTVIFSADTTENLSTKYSQWVSAMGGSFYLEEGEQVYIVKTQSQKASGVGAATALVSRLDIIELGDHACDPAFLDVVEGYDPPSYLVSGVKDHYTCTECGKLWANSEATVPATEENLVIAPVGSFVEPEKTGHTFFMGQRLKAKNALADAPMTIEAWINVREDAPDRRLNAIYSNYVNDSTPYVSLEIIENGTPKLCWAQNSGSANSVTFTDVDVRTGEWMHLVVTRDFANKTGSCYINGELVQTVSFAKSSTTVETSTNPMCVGGANNASNTYYFKQGKIHSVAAYSDVRTATEIEGNYKNGVTEGGDDLLAYYIVSPEGNERLQDYSAYQNHLTRTNQEGTTVGEEYIPVSTIKYYGSTFGWNDNYIDGDLLEKFPRNVKATVYFPDLYSDQLRGGIIYGNYSGKAPSFALEIFTDGTPRLYIQNEAGVVKDIKFASTNVYNGQKTTIEVAIETNQVKLYVDGVLTETKSSSGIGAFVDAIKPTRKMVVGGDWRDRNPQYFKGQLIDLEIGGIGKYDFTVAGETVTDLSGNGNDLTKSGYFIDYEVPQDFAYSMLVLGDPQYVNDRHPENFDKIYDWILNNVETHKIKYLMSMGDTTDTSDITEWNRAKEQFARLDGILPYSVVRGNHDRNAGFNDAFNTPEYNATIDGKYGDGVENTYRYVTIGSVKYLIMTLDHGAADDVLEWANEVVAAHPHHNVIVTVHAYLKKDGSYLTSSDKWAASGDDLVNGGWKGYNYSPEANDGDEIWDKFVRKHENISMVICGHMEASEVVMSEAIGDNGNVVKQLLVDYQGIDYNLHGGTGMVTLLYFNEDGTEFEVRSYSTIYDGEHYEELSYNSTVNTVETECKGGEATCQKGAVCEICGEEYTAKSDKHADENGTWTNGNGTHSFNRTCCDETDIATENCTYGSDNICDKCGYDCTVEVEKNDLNNAISNIVNGTSNSVTVVGPTGTMADDYIVEKIEGVAYEYKYFNIAFDDEDNFFLRHHIVCEGALTVTVNGTPVELKSDSANVYYFDTYYEAGQFHVGKDIVINGDAYNVSLYSYIKLALEGEIADLDASEETFLRALYDLNEALR